MKIHTNASQLALTRRHAECVQLVTSDLLDPELGNGSKVAKRKFFVYQDRIASRRVLSGAVMEGQIEL